MRHATRAEISHWDDAIVHYRASEASQRGHVNLYDAGRLEAATRTVFHNVFLFGLNDEIVHTGFTSMMHYLMALGCSKRAVPPIPGVVTMSR